MVAIETWQEKTDHHKNKANEAALEILYVKSSNGARARESKWQTVALFLDESSFLIFHTATDVRFVRFVASECLLPRREISWYSDYKNYLSFCIFILALQSTDVNA